MGINTREAKTVRDNKGATMSKAERERLVVEILRAVERASRFQVGQAVAVELDAIEAAAMALRDGKAGR